MLAPVRTVAPADTPVSLTEAKAHLRVDGSSEDTLITALVAAATEHLDGWGGILGRALVTQTWRQEYSAFTSPLRLPLYPVASVTSVTYYDVDNAQQTLSTSVYSLFADGLGHYVGLQPDEEWPGTYSRPDAVSVTYVAGVAAASVPAPIKAAILLMVGDLYANRENQVIGTITSLNKTTASLIGPYARVGM